MSPRDHPAPSHSDPARLNVFRWAEHLNFDQLERQHHLPRGLMTALMRQESFGWNDRGSRAGAEGLLQIMPHVANAPRYRINPNNPHQAASVAATELGDHWERYNGNLAMTLAAYNHGSGNLSQLMRRHGDRWQEHLPRETRNYIANIRADLSTDAAIRTLYHRFKDTSIRDPRNADRIDDALLDNAAIRQRVRTRLREHGYDPGTSDWRLHRALSQFEQRIEDRDMRTYGTRFVNDGQLDFASLNLLMTRTPGVSNLLDNPRHR